MTAPLYVSLLHYPVYKKDGEVITTSITPLDLHDIARSCATFGVKRYYVVNHMPTMQYLARRVAEFWLSDYGAKYNKTRTDAITNMRLVEHIEDGMEEIARECGQPPLLVATTARQQKRAIGCEAFRRRLETEDRPFLLLFGTGWGLIDSFLDRCDVILEPICGPVEYNHLSVRSAAAIMLDRLCGIRK
ncbi:MAG: RNA methyltransferase [bacterium]|nr:RNA methyltransferase [bacterium]